MSLALNEAGAAYDRGEFPVGCVVVQDGRVVAAGSRKGTAPGVKRASELDHAEMRALRCLEEEIDDFSPSRAVLYCTMEPCLMCFAAIVLAGIKTVVYAYEDVMGGGTSCDFSVMPPLYSRSGMTVVPGVCRSDSLDLFVKFFQKKDNEYWRNSLLEAYTFEQAGGL